MPRVGEPDRVHPELPWDEWQEMLKGSATGAIYFEPSEFGGYSQMHFMRLAKRHFASLGANAYIRGDEVMVALDA